MKKQYQIDPANLLKYHFLNKKIAAKKSNSTRIVLFGDSRIHQWNPLPEIPGCEFINRGIPGETTSQSLLRLEEDVISLKPDIAIIQFGVNDCNSIGILPEFENFIVQNCKKNISSTIDKLRKSNIKTAILTIFPVGPVDPLHFFIWSDKTRSAIKEINTHILRIDSVDIKSVNCDNIFLDGKTLQKESYHDMIHLNSEGYRQLNKHIKLAIEDFQKDINQRD